MGPGVGFPLGSDCKLAWEAEREEGQGVQRRSAQLHPVTWALCSGSSPVRWGQEVLIPSPQARWDERVFLPLH